MRFEFKPSFERSIKSLVPSDKEDIKAVAVYLMDILSKDRPLHQGIGLKRLHGPFWEVRKGIRAKILFRWDSDLVEFILAGNHDVIKRFLRGI